MHSAHYPTIYGGSNFKAIDTYIFFCLNGLSGLLHGNSKAKAFGFTTILSKNPVGASSSIITANTFGCNYHSVPFSFTHLPVRLALPDCQNIYNCFARDDFSLIDF